MTQSFSQNHPENTYVIDAESEAEMARLIDQERLFTQAMGGVLSEQDDLSAVNMMLDIGCGPGGWVLDVAHRYPHIDVTGIDISRNMIRYAQAYTQVRQLSNAHFEVMDVLKPLDFPNDTFDLVNARFLVGFVSPNTWPSVIGECRRILRPGGILRLTECETGFTNKVALETLWNLTFRAFARSGRSFSPTGNHFGVTPMLERLLRLQGFETIERTAYAFSYDAGSRNHAAMYEDLKLAFQLIPPFLLSTGVTEKEELDRLYEQAMKEMLEEDFCAMSYLLTVWGKKP